TELPEGPQQRKVSNSTLEGILVTPSGSVNLKDDGGLPTVLAFGSTMCSSCNEEAQAFRDHLKDKTRGPTKIRLLTVLVGATAGSVDRWKQRYQIPWTVAYDTDASVFKQFCEEDTVPCLIIHLPDQGVVLREHGIVEMERIVNLTGPWED